MSLLQVGNWVHCILYGGKDGVIYAIHGEQKPETCSTIFRGVGVMGGNADFDIVWEDGTESRRIPESLVRGSVQWRVLDEPLATADKIADMRKFAAEDKARKESEEKTAADKFKADMQALKTNPAYSHLEQIQPGIYGSCGKLVASNLRREFKKLWPTIKFSVRKEHHGCVNIHWMDGPTENQVKEVTQKYSGGYFDGMEDLYVHSHSPFTSVFGSCDYIFPRRSHSVEALKEAVREVCLEYGWPLVKVEESTDGTAYLPCDNQDRYRKVYDWIERRYEYEQRAEQAEQEPEPEQGPQPGDAEYETLRARVAELEARRAS